MITIVVLKIEQLWFTLQLAADAVEKRLDPQGLHFLYRPICPNT